MKSKTIKKVSIAVKPNPGKDVINVLKKLTEWLIKHNKEIQFLARDKEIITSSIKMKENKITFIKKVDIHRESDIIITIGGDGTLMGIGRLTYSHSVPIIGVNMGKMGFITEFSENEILKTIENSFKDLIILKLSLFVAEIFREDKPIYKKYFINDAVIHKNDISRMFSLSASFGDKHIFNLSGDGIIISSPIGSTAYSMAAGGPLIYPDVKTVTLTPICPHSLTHRPLVLPDNSNLFFELIESPSSVSLTIDGQVTTDILPGDVVKISKNSAKTIQLVKNPNNNYFQNLKDIFILGHRKNRNE